MSHLFIAGRWVAGSRGSTFDVINPADQSVLAKLDAATPEDVVAAVQAARQAFDEGEWPTRPAGARAAVLLRVAERLQREQESLAHTETLDTGKTLRESRLDVADAAAVFRYYAALCGSTSDRLIETEAPAVLSRVVREPVGVCALITPWNYPLLQVSWKLAPALAAGNTCVVKPSEITPLSTIALVELIVEAGVPSGVVNLLQGTGPEVGASLVAQPGIDMVSFTGGLRTGREIAHAAAESVTRVALELGGNNPNIVFADADYVAAVDYAVTAAFLHSGQVCSAGARLIVEDELYDRFVADVAAKAARIRLGNGLDEASEVGPLVSAAHREQVERYVELGRAEGARLVTGGRRPGDPALAGGFYYEPTVFADCVRTMRVVREEVFGPVLTVERFSDESQAVTLGNDTDYGLAGAVWTSDAARAERVARSLRHGTVWINDYHPYLPQAEWGGFKRSGIGRELGPGGLAEYQEAKHIYTNLSPAPLHWFAG